jgi:hypothetical protein
VFGATFAGVVPICVAAAACSGSTTSPSKGDAAGDSQDDVVYYGVAACAYDACGVGVAVDAFAPHPDGSSDAPSAPDQFLGVAATGFEAGDG